ncbi:mitochondrial fission ELM1 family protein [Coraliomargarita sp. SDUM461003]|uniref:Mitochondrial fission ELM1 family protein n=2 Tax=Thalassobacterium maritimum TaxID=3041265 RepID=A0ABU1AYD6_9BACT|nr:mitochondrial fission ELM1 family protein [Coraliomargarita sp. SDUM461003]
MPAYFMSQLQNKMAPAKIIWQICDHKRGHENQSSGLIHALSKQTPIEPIRIDIDSHKASWWQAVRGTFPSASTLPQPDLIIAAGSQTHSSLLAAGRATGAPTLLIMAPPKGLTRFFDLCVVPAHDQRQGPNIIQTTGAMNTVEASPNKAPNTGLFLIGGPSQHHNWDEAALLNQISTILNSNSQLQWKLTTSRRTPESTTARLQSLESNQLEVIPVEQTKADWLPQQLGRSSYVWVTEDSVSMVYEALSSGAKVGLLPVPRKAGESRIIRGLDALQQSKHVLSYSEDQTDLTSFKAPPPLNEAARIAKIVSHRFF